MKVAIVLSRVNISHISGLSFELVALMVFLFLPFVLKEPPTRPSTTAMTTTRTTETAITTTQTSLITGSDLQCDQLFDVIFVMDSSRSINAPQYVREKDFVKELATILNVGAGTRAAVIIYSDDTQLEIRFDQHRNLDSFKLAVDALPHLQLRTRIDKALTMAAQVLTQAR